MYNTLTIYIQVTRCTLELKDLEDTTMLCSFFGSRIPTWDKVALCCSFVGAWGNMCVCPGLGLERDENEGALKALK